MAHFSRRVAAFGACAAGSVRRPVQALRLLVLVLSLGAAYSAQAGTDVCSDPLYKPPADSVGVVDGDVPAVQALLPRSSFTIDTNCQFRNFLLSATWPNGLEPTLNFKTPAAGTKPVYLITFDKVFFSGNLACSSIPHKLWVVNSPEVQNGRVNGLFSQSCQALFIPAEQITKATPGPYATIGVPFTYTLTLPSMMTGMDTNGNITYGPSPNALGDVVLTDNLDATGVALTLVGTPVVTWVGSGAPVNHVFTQSTSKGGLLTFDLPSVPAGQQIKIEITVVLDDTNTVGTTFTNTAEWIFSRAIDLDENNIIEDGTADLDGDGIFEDEYFNPLPGESGVSAPMTIVEPTLVVTKTGPDVLGGLNLGEWGEFTIEARNTGFGDAWGVTILDRLPNEPSNPTQVANGGMCDMTPEVTGVRIIEADGTTSRTLLQESGYSLSYTGPPTCELSLTLSEDAGPIASGERLVLDYRTKLDADSDNGAVVTNVAAATWFNGTSANTNRQSYGCTPTDGTLGTDDCQDAHDVMVVLSGFFFEKSVENLTTGESPTTGAAPGDRLRYTLRVQSTSDAMANINISDVLPAAFDWSTLTVIPTAGATVSTNAATRTITISIPSLGTYSDIAIQFEATLTTTVAAGTVVSNQATLSADGVSSALSDDPNVNGQANPAVAGDEDPTEVLIYQPTPATAPLKEALQSTATIGEEVTYRITVPGTPRNRVTEGVAVTDTLAAAITFVSASVTLNGASLTLTTNQSGQDLSWSIGTIPAGQQAVITLVARVVNSEVTNAGDTISNTAAYAYSSGTQSLVSAPAEVTIVEPVVAMTKGVTPTTPPTAGDVLHYTVSLTATSDVNTSNVYDLALVDTLSIGLAYEPGTARVGGVALEPVVTPGDGVSTSEVLTWTGVDIMKATTTVVTYDVRVQNSVVVGQTLSNSATAHWTSLDGTSDFERTGTGAPAYNDYFMSASTNVTTADNTTLSKARLTDTYAPLDAEVRVGDYIDYELRIGLQEGSHTGLILTDTLPTGLAFVEVVSANYFGASVSPPPAPTPSGQTLTWTLGDVVNNADNNAANDYLVIVYRARVMNADTLTQLPTRQDLRNSATLDYTVGGAAAPQLAATQTISVKQPMLTVSKAAAPAGGDTLLAPNELVRYAVEIANSGEAPAYDAVLVDTLPLGLRAAGVRTISMTLVNAGTELPPFGPAFDVATGVATWDFDTDVADAYTIPAGETLRVVYEVNADASLGAGLTLTNAAQVSVYYSFDDEAVPPYGAADQREVYGPTNTANQTLITPTPNPPSKTNMQPTATIGEQFKYKITVPASPAGTALNDVRILDDLSLSSADLRFVSATVVQGGAWTLSNTSGSDTNLVIEGAGNGIDIPAGGQAIIEVTVELVNSTANNRGLAFTNTASYIYNQTDGDAATRTAGGASVTAAMTVVEPLLTVSKTVSNITASKTATDAVVTGDTLEYVVTIRNTGDSTAYEANVADTLPPGLALAGPATATLNGNAVTTFAGTPGTSSSGALVWGRENGDSSLTLSPGDELALTYAVDVVTASGTSLTNSVYADWTSLLGANAAERTGAGCPSVTAPNDYCAGPATVTIAIADTNAIRKDVVSDTWDTDPSQADDRMLRVGDTAVYRLTLTLREGDTQNVVVTDTLPAGLVFDGVVRVNGDAIAPFSPTAPFGHADIAAPSVANGIVTWTLGDITNTSADGDDDVFVIEYRARVMNQDALSPSPNSQDLTNNVALSYTGGDPAAQPARLTHNATITVKQPMLEVHKSAVTAGDDTVVEAGEAITYTVDIANTGEAPAYDAVLVDTLPVGLRQGGITTMSITVIDTATGTTKTTPAAFAPAYSATTGVASWNFDSGTANAYTIAPGETLRVVYRVVTDGDVGPGLTLTNAAQATRYYSFDDEAVPAGGNASQREVYGPSDVDSVQLTTPTPGALLKENTQSTAAVGERFTYRITVPATPVNTALHDVRILDDLSASAADLRFVGVAKVSGSGSWTPVNTGTSTNLIIEDTSTGIDIPAGEQVVVEITVELLNTAANTVGLTFTNTADYTYNRIANTPTTRSNGSPGTSGPMQIIALSAHKIVAIDIDANANGMVDPGDVLMYTLSVNNPGSRAATGAVLTDDVPADTTYVADSVTLNGANVGQPDSGVSPLIAGVAINSPTSTTGTLAAGSTAVITFKVQVNAGVPAGTVISNQGYVSSNGFPTEPTDADGDPANGYQPTTVVVGTAQQVMITKDVSVVGGGAALPGSELQYLVRISNTGTTTATNVEITDDLGLLAGQATYVAGSATLAGPGTLAVGTGTNPMLTAMVGDLAVGASVVLQFRVLVDQNLATGTRLTNTAQIAWNTPTMTATASASIDIGGALGSATLNGHVWHDTDFDNLVDAAERNLAGWNVTLYRNNVQIGSTTTDANGVYAFTGLDPTLTTAGQYELRFAAPGAGANTAKLGLADSAFTNGMQRISGITAPSGGNLQDLNLPIDPNGVVFDSVARSPIAGATLTVLRGGAPVASSCFDDPAQQNQVTLASGFYKFDLNFSDASCPQGGDYVIQVTPPATGYVAGASRVIPPLSSDQTAAYGVASCTADAVAAPADYCEAQASEYAPATTVPASQVSHYLHLTLSNPLPNDSQLFNNHIALDPTLQNALTITKTSALVNVSRGQLVPYTITLHNTLGVDLSAMSIVDTFPPGFKYVDGSSRVNGQPLEPAKTDRQLTWSDLQVAHGTPLTIKLVFIVGSGVSEGEYVNRAQTFHPDLGAVTGEGTATVRVAPDPTFDCTDIIGKVFDDTNANGYQDDGEIGLPGARVASARGLIARTDEHGRFHITCAAIPNEDRGSNFILKLDDRSLPSGYRVTTENPRVERLTRGKMAKLNFGAAIHRVVRLDIADGVFEENSTQMRPQWVSRIGLLLDELRKAPAVLRLSYLADVEDEALATARVNALKQDIADRWAQLNCCYVLTTETEIFWRRGGPPVGVGRD